eukprot:6768790-Prymnesium_polylepis.1
MPLCKHDVDLYIRECKDAYRDHDVSASGRQLARVAEYLHSWIGACPRIVLLGSSPYPERALGVAFGSPGSTKTLRRIGELLDSLGCKHDVEKPTWWSQTARSRGVMALNLSPACSDTASHSKQLVRTLSASIRKLLAASCSPETSVTLIGKLAHRCGSQLRLALGAARVSRAFQPAA